MNISTTFIVVLASVFVVGPLYAQDSGHDQAACSTSAPLSASSEIVTSATAVEEVVDNVYSLILDGRIPLMLAKPEKKKAWYKSSESCPLGPLVECNCAEFRNVRPKFRQHILDHLKEKFSDRSQPIVLTSFASGGLGFEFKLLRLLIKNGFTNIHINLVDVLYPKGAIKETGDFTSEDKVEEQDRIAWQHQISASIDEMYLSGAKAGPDVERLRIFRHYFRNFEKDAVVTSHFAKTLSEVPAESSDLIIDLDSGGHFDSAASVVAQGFLKNNGIVMSMTSDWDYTLPDQPKKCNKLHLGTKDVALEEDGNLF
jgi:hypothetical protein